MDYNLHGNIVEFNTSAALFDGYADGELTLCNNDIFGNEWTTSEATVDAGGNFSMDPRFCNRFEGDFTLQQASPCLPENGPNAELVGARGQGCVPVVGDLRMRPPTINIKVSETVTAVLTGENVDDIDPATVRLNGLVAPMLDDEGGSRGKHDADGPILTNHPNSRLALEFDTSELLSTLALGMRRHRIVASAQLADGRPIRATDEVLIMGFEEESDPGTLAAGLQTPASATAPATPGLQVVTPNPFNPVTRIHYGLATAGERRNADGQRRVLLPPRDRRRGADAEDDFVEMSAQRRACCTCRLRGADRSKCLSAP